MPRLLSTVSRSALAVAMLAGVAPAVLADPILIDTTTTSTVTVDANDVLTVTATGKIDAASDDGVIWNGATSGDGVVIHNYGTITTQVADGRAIDTSGGAGTTPRVITLYNYEDATITSGDDAFRINANYSGAVVTVENWGEMSSTNGQVIDFAALTSATSITVKNHGDIISGGADAIRLAPGAKVVNDGLIEVLNEDGTKDGDAIDFRDYGGTVENLATGTISGAKHGVTGKDTATITNYADIPQVACRLTSRSPDVARWASVFRPERCLSSRKRPKSGGSSLEPAAFWPGRAAFPRGRRTCPAAFVQLGHGSWSCA